LLTVAALDPIIIIAGLLDCLELLPSCVKFIELFF